MPTVKKALAYSTAVRLAAKTPHDMYLPDRRAKRVVKPLYGPAPDPPARPTTLDERCAKMKLRQMKLRLQKKPSAKVIAVEPPAYPVQVVEPPQHRIWDLPNLPECVVQVKDVLGWLWSWRPCLVCGCLDACKHRQPDDDIAQLTEWYQQLRLTSERKGEEERSDRQRA